MRLLVVEQDGRAAARRMSPSQTSPQGARLHAPRGRAPRPPTTGRTQKTFQKALPNKQGNCLGIAPSRVLGVGGGDGIRASRARRSRRLRGTAAPVTSDTRAWRSRPRLGRWGTGRRARAAPPCTPRRRTGGRTARARCRSRARSRRRRRRRTSPLAVPRRRRRPSGANGRGRTARVTAGGTKKGRKAALGRRRRRTSCERATATTMASRGGGQTPTAAAAIAPVVSTHRKLRLPGARLVGRGSPRGQPRPPPVAPRGSLAPLAAERGSTSRRRRPRPGAAIRRRQRCRQRCRRRRADGRRLRDDGPPPGGARARLRGDTTSSNGENVTSQQLRVTANFA